MARGKKKEELTLEEKLERALVQVEEPPYEVPENWCWTYLTHGFCECMDSFRKPINASERAKREGDIPYYGATGQVGWIDDYLTDEQLVLVGEDGAPFFDAVKDKAYMIDGKAWVNNHAHILKSYYGEVGNKFIMNYLNSFNYKGYVNGTTRLKLTQASMSTIPVPLPPLQEQQRIVERIENLFSKLDEAKEKVQEVFDGYAIREASLLQKAVSGELTQEWREKNGISKIDWEIISLKDCGTWFGGGTPKTSKKEYWDGGTIPWITSKDMKDRLIEDSLLHITQEGVNNSSAQYCDKPAVLFVMRSGILRRILPVCMIKVPFTVNQDLKAVIPEKIQQEYLYWACTAYEKDIRENCMKSGTTVESIGAKKLLDYKLPLPNEREQKEIVDIIESLLHKEEFVKQVAIQILEKIDIMKKSILSKAFRGELGTNKLEEGNSMELLKEILVKI